MATQTHNNYTITNVTYSVTGGANVFASFQTAVLTITPDLGYIVNAEDFAWINTSLANIATVIFTQSGVNVTCTVTFDNPFSMPSANTVKSLCISGSAVKQRITVQGSFKATGVSTNMSIVADSPVPEEISFSAFGLQGQEVLLLEKTYTVSSGYKFETDFNILFSGLQMNEDSYNVTYTKTLDASGNLTSINIKVYYTFPSVSVYNDKLTLAIPAKILIFVPLVKINNYRVDTSLAPYSGASRVLRVYGAAGATFTVASGNGQILYYAGSISNVGVITYYTTTPTLTMPAAGYFDINIDIPVVTSNATYAFTIGGGNLVSPFPLANPFYIYQKTDTVLTFTATGSGMTIANLDGAVNQLKTYPANSVPTVGSSAYNVGWTWTVSAANGNDLSIDAVPDVSAWSNVAVVEAATSSAINNTNVIPVVSATGIATGMRVAGFGVPIGVTYVVTGVSGTNITVSGGNLTLISGADLQFTSSGGSELNLGYEVTLNESSTIASVTTSGYVEKYGDENKTFNLDLTKVLTISGASNECRSWNIAGAGSGVFNQGGSLQYYDCITKSARAVFPVKGEADFAICALQTPVPVVTGDVTATLTSTVCNDGTDQACYQYSVVYNPQNVKNPPRTVTVSYIDCATNALTSITIAISSTATTFCANRFDPTVVDSTGSTTITRAVDSGNCP